MAEGGRDNTVTVADKVELQDFTVKTKNSDVTFIVEDQQVYASRVVLSIASPVFNEMFENSKGKELEVPGIKLDHFVEFLKCIYPDILQEIDETTVYWIAPLAHKYRVKVLRRKCIQLLLVIIKKNYVKNAVELYRHIKLSELLDLQEVETLCVEMASECSLDEMEEADKEYPILHLTGDKIVKMALRRHEAARQDEKCIKNYTHPSTNIAGHINGLLEDRMYVGKQWVQKQRQEKAKNYMQALRLIYYDRYADLEYLKNTALEKFISLGQLDDADMKVYQLLPEEIKRDVEKFSQNG